MGTREKVRRQSVLLQVRLFPEELAEIKSLAAVEEKTVSECVRDRMLFKSPEPVKEDVSVPLIERKKPVLLRTRKGKPLPALTTAAELPVPASTRHTAESNWRTCGCKACQKKREDMK